MPYLKSTTNSGRYYYIDVLKLFALLCLFLAHVSAPAWLEEIRGFDVPMLVFLSGYLSRESFRRSGSILNYLRKRVERLVVPTWIFLLVFYACMAAAGQFPDWGTVMRSFFFQRDSGIAGGVWIIWIYLICALVAPALMVLNRRLGEKALLFWVGLFVGYEIMSSVQFLVENRIIYYTFFCIIPYGAVLLFGIVYEDLTRGQKIFVITALIAAHLAYCVVFAVKGEGYQHLNDYKYPARGYYITYALPVTMLLLEAMKRLDPRLPRLGVVEFASAHSLWVYLWQIMMLAVVNYVLGISEHWVLCLVIITVGSFALTWVQNQVVELVRRRRDFYALRYLTC